MIYSPDDIMRFGANRGLPLSEIYHHKPSYIEFLIKYIPDFEIDVNEFLKLPNPVIAAPDPVPLKEPGGISFTPHIFLEASVEEIKQYMEGGGKMREIQYSFSNEMLEILRLKSLGEYIAPEYVKPKRIRSEDIDIMLYTIEGTFYSNEKNSVDYLRFYRDKTVLHLVERKPLIPLDMILRLLDKENSDIAKGEYLITSSILADYFKDKLRPPEAKININSKISISIFEPRDKIERKFSGEIISKNEILIGQKTYVRLAPSNT
jgi:hypothetical protein